MTDKPQRWVLQGRAEVWEEDDGTLCLLQVNDQSAYPNGFSVRVQSWRRDGRDHPVEGFNGRQVRVVVNVLDEEPDDESISTGQLLAELLDLYDAIASQITEEETTESLRAIYRRAGMTPPDEQKPS